MFSISIAMGRGTPVVWALMFRTEKYAQDTFKILQETMGDATVSDDFGQAITVVKANVVGMMFEDLEKSRVAHVERVVHEQKIRAAAVTRIQSDSSLRNIVPAGGPAVLGNGLMR